MSFCRLTSFAAKHDSIDSQLSLPDWLERLLVHHFTQEKMSARLPLQREWKSSTQTTDEGFGRQLQVRSPSGLLVKINELEPELYT